MAVPYTFGSATTSIPLSQLDSNFATTITLGNTAVQLGNTITNLTGVSNVASATSLSLGSNGNTTAITVDTSQNVGIGTASPATKLNIATTGADVEIRASTTTSGNVRIGFDLSGAYYNWIQTLRSGGAMQFATDNSERMRISSAGNVGIGTNSPSAKLQVSDGTTTLDLNPTGGVVYFGTSTNHPMIFNTNNTERMRIDSSGSLLVGKTALSETTAGFQVSTNGVPVTTCNANTLVFYNNVASAYRFFVTAAGTINATNTTITGISDQRLKENIIDLPDGLNAVMALKPRKFDWKTGKGKNIRGDRGFIAQEFEAVFPDMIEEWLDPAPEGEEPYKGINANLIPTLVKAIQELKAINDTQAETINALTARIVALESK